jgi:hypothetical protein
MQIRMQTRRQFPSQFVFLKGIRDATNIIIDDMPRLGIRHRTENSVCEGMTRDYLRQGSLLLFVLHGMRVN